MSMESAEKLFEAGIHKGKNLMRSEIKREKYELAKQLNKLMTLKNVPIIMQVHEIVANTFLKLEGEDRLP